MCIWADLDLDSDSESDSESLLSSLHYVRMSAMDLSAGSQLPRIVRLRHTPRYNSIAVCVCRCQPSYAFEGNSQFRSSVLLSAIILV